MDFFISTFGYATPLISIFLFVTGFILITRPRLHPLIDFGLFYTVFFILTCTLLELLAKSFGRYPVIWGGQFGDLFYSFFGRHNWLILLFNFIFYCLLFLYLYYRARVVAPGVPFFKTFHGKLLLFISLFLIVAIALTGQFFFDRGRVKFALYSFGFMAIFLIPVLTAFRRISLPVRKFPVMIEVALLILAIALGAYLRIHRIETLPPGCWFDESENGLEALKLYPGNQHTPYTKGYYSKETLYLYFIALFFQLFGVSTLSMRLVSVMFGILTIPAFFLLVRYKFGTKVGLVVTILFALSHWHLFFSRIAFRAIMMPLIQVLATYFFLKAIEKGTYRNYLVAGVFAGIGIYTYIPFRIFPILLVILFIHQLLYKRIDISRHLLGLCIFGFSALIVCIPMILFIFEYPDIYFRRTSQVSIFGRYDKAGQQDALINGIHAYFLMFNVTGDGNLRHNDGAKPELNFFVGLLAFIGFVSALFRIWKPFYLFSLLWLVALLIPGIVTIVPPNCLRGIGTLPVAFIFSAMGISLLWKGFHYSLKAPGEILMWILMAGSIIYSFKDTYSLYFNRYPIRGAIYDSFNYTEWAMSEHIRKHSSAKTVFYATATADRTLNFLLTGHHVNLRKYFYLADIPVRNMVTSDVLFIMGTPYHQDAIPLIKDFYPDASIERVNDPRGRLLFYTALLSKKSVNDLFGLTGHFRTITDADGFHQYNSKYLPARSRQTVIVEDIPLPHPYEGKWDGGLMIEDMGEYVFTVKANNPVKILIDDETILDMESRDSLKEESSETLTLTRGFHEYSMEYTARSTPARFSLQFNEMRNHQLRHILPVFFDWKVKDNKLRALKTRRSQYHYKLETTIQPKTRGPQETLRQPRGIAMDADGNFWIANTMQDTIVKISSLGNVLGFYGGKGRELGKFDNPVDLCFGSNGTLYVLDAWNNRMQMLDSNGAPILEKKSGFWYPSSLAIDKHDTVYVSDNGSRTIKRFSSRLVPKGSLSGSTLQDGNFFIPIAVAVDDREYVYVAESDNHRFQIVDKAGRHVNSWPLYNSGPINRIIVLSPDQILLSDANLRKIFIFNENGDMLTHTGLENLKYNFPTGFHYDGKNKLSLLDGNRILVFSVVKNTNP